MTMTRSPSGIASTTWIRGWRVLAPVVVSIAISTSPSQVVNVALPDVHR
jgi:hypothetical protein